MDLTLLAQHPQYVAAAMPLVLPAARALWCSFCERLNDRWDREEAWDRFVEARDAQETRTGFERMSLDQVREMLDREAATKAAEEALRNGPRPITSSGNTADQAVDTLAEAHGVPASVIAEAVSWAAMSYTSESA